MRFVSNVIYNCSLRFDILDINISSACKPLRDLINIFRDLICHYLGYPPIGYCIILQRWSSFIWYSGIYAFPSVFDPFQVSLNRREITGSHFDHISVDICRLNSKGIHIHVLYNECISNPKAHRQYCPVLQRSIT